MTGRRAIGGLCMMCALLISAFAAQSANAAASGTTGTVPAGTGYKGEVTVANTGADTLLHSVISGIEVELKSTELTGSGTMESMTEVEEHTSNGSGTITFNSVSVVKPAGKGCEVVGAQVKTEQLKATTAGQGDAVLVEPQSGTTLAKFEVKNCGPTEALKALNGEYKVTGSVKGKPSGGETIFNRSQTTVDGTMKLRGQTAGIAGAFVFKRKSDGATIQACKFP